ncbi:MAG: VOC family protein, partial [Ktedonobacteraceae bacterium]|nr:VOC family protein [Ktedonobacteraceae bacterium]
MSVVRKWVRVVSIALQGDWLMITGLGHVAFRITDLEKSLDFYCKKLGFR